MNGPIFLSYTCSCCGGSDVDTPQNLFTCGHTICGDCTIIAWYHKAPIAPHIDCPACGEYFHFPTPPLIESVFLDREMLEASEKLREDPFFPHRDIVVFYSEAQHLLHELYSACLDQLLDPQRLGDISDWSDTSSANSNTIFANIAKYFSDPEDLDKIKPMDLEQHLLAILQTSLVTYAKVRYATLLPRLSEWRIAEEMGDNKKCYDLVMENMHQVRQIGEIWTEVLRKFVGILAVTHFTRVGETE